MSEKLSDIALPEGLTNGGHADSVRWTAFKKDGTEVGKWGYSACYSSIMKELGEYEIHCRPYWNRPPNSGAYSNHPANEKWVAKDAEVRDSVKCKLPSDLYKRFWRLCKQSGLVHRGVRISTREGQNHMMVPREGWDRHTVYTALSLYRHCDCHPKIPATAVLLYNKLRKRGVHFLQCLHYAMAEHNSPNSGHVFITVNAAEQYHSNCGGRNIAAGMAMAHFSQLDIRERKALEPDNSTVMAFCGLATQWNPIKEGTTKSYYSATPTNGSGTPVYKLTSMESILLPKFAPLYEDPTGVTMEEFADVVAEECKK